MLLFYVVVVVVVVTFLCVLCVTGFIVSPFLETVGYRKMHALCTLVGGLGMAASVFANNIHVFWILFGLVGGWLSCVYTHIIVNNVGPPRSHSFTTTTTTTTTTTLIPSFCRFWGWCNTILQGSLCATVF